MKTSAAVKLSEENLLQEMPVDKLVKIYRNIRAAKEALEEEMKVKVGELKEQMEAIEERLLEICTEQNVDSLRTANGTVVRTHTVRYWTSDWDSFYDFIFENDACDLLEKRINNTNMKNFLEENPDKMPVGLNADSRYKITVRKPHSK